MNETKKMVPGEIAAAVSTRRPELLTPLRARIKNGSGTISKEDALTLLDLIADAIKEAQDDDERRRVLVERVKGFRGNFSGAIGTLDKMIAEFEGKAAPGEDGDDG
jgi:hypothetical protein